MRMTEQMKKQLQDLIRFVQDVETENLLTLAEHERDLKKLSIYNAELMNRIDLQDWTENCIYGPDAFEWPFRLLELLDREKDNGLTNEDFDFLFEDFEW